MWIAYKIYYLCDRKQLAVLWLRWRHSCELLTKFIIFAIGNNWKIFDLNAKNVVNCLQNLLSLRSETTRYTSTGNVLRLWIAYKIYYLCDRKQRPECGAEFTVSCELLTKFIIFAIGNNYPWRTSRNIRVVNCLQNLLSLRSETT